MDDYLPRAKIIPHQLADQQAAIEQVVTAVTAAILPLLEPKPELAEAKARLLAALKVVNERTS